MEAAAHREAAGRTPWRRLLAGAAAIVAVVLAIWWTSDRGSIGREPARVTIDRLTSSGTAIDAATSRDGRYLAWVESAGGLQGLRIRQQGGDRSIELVPPATVGYWGIAFAEDGSRVFYATKSAQEPAGRLYVVDVLGAQPRALVDGIDSTITFAPDGRTFAFYRAGFPQRGSSALIVADADGGNQRVLASVAAPRLFVPGFFAAPSWSPDGARIAAAVRDVKTGDAWTGDGRRLLRDHRSVSAAVSGRHVHGLASRRIRGFCSWRIRSTRSENPAKVWLQPYPSGAPHRVTPDLLEYRNVSPRGDGRAFVAVGLDAVDPLWRLPLDGRAPQRIASERYDGLLGVAPLEDGRLVVSTGEEGELAAGDPRPHRLEPPDTDERGHESVAGRVARPEDHRLRVES